MRALAVIAVLAVCAVSAAPDPARPQSWIGPPPAPAIPAPTPGGTVKERPHREFHFGERPRRDRDHRDRPHRERHPPRGPALPYGYYFDDDDHDDYDESAVVPSPPPVAPPPVAPPPEAAPADQPPPDPRGQSRFIPARGATPSPAPYQIGEPLPPDVPHVTLNWAYYGLPEPQPGRIYARVGHEVLLIEAATRFVVGVVELPEPTPPGS